MTLLCSELTMCGAVRLLLLLVLLVAGVQCDEWSRQKRSDDHPALESVVSGLSQQLTQMSAQLTALQNQHNQLTARFDASQKQVSFLARNSADPFNVAAAGTLVYNLADTNFGGGYDTLTGIFTSPTPGLYVFFINCKGVTGALDDDKGVLVEGTRVCGCYTYSKEFSISGSGMATVHLKAGQRVWVHAFRDSARDIRGHYWSTFAGFLVKTDD